MKWNKSFNNITQLWEYILKSNLKAMTREWNKVILHNNTTWNYVETVTANFK